MAGRADPDKLAGTHMFTFTALALVVTAVMLPAHILSLSWLSAVVLNIAVLLLIQSLSVTYAMTYTRVDRLRVLETCPPRRFLQPRYSFTLIIPARQEERVISQTIQAMNRINYPERLFKVIVIVRSDDTKTNAAVNDTFSTLQRSGFEKRTFDDGPINKPHALNVGLLHADGDIVGIFDAEDEPHVDILNIINTTMLQTKAEVVQSGVQLVDVASRWFSALNALEYFFWFSSILPCLFHHRVTPLAGNSVFFRAKALRAIGGWDETCLTEDVDIGIRLAALGIECRTVYHPQTATHEETPPDMVSFARQRTRWFQGYLRVLLKGAWLRLPTLRQRCLTFYLLIQPLMHIVTIAGLVSMILSSLVPVVPVGVALLTFIPGFMLCFQIALRVVALQEMRDAFRLSFSRRLYIDLIIFYLPYQFMLSYSALRAIARTILRRREWEKTPHRNAHRTGTVPALS